MTTKDISYFFYMKTKRDRELCGKIGQTEDSASERPGTCSENGEKNLVEGLGWQRQAEVAVAMAVVKIILVREDQGLSFVWRSFQLQSNLSGY